MVDLLVILNLLCFMRNKTLKLHMNMHWYIMFIAGIQAAHFCSV